MDNKEFLELMIKAKDKFLVSDFPTYLKVTQLLINSKETDDFELYELAKQEILYM